jgi:hypothetical protein
MDPFPGASNAPDYGVVVDRLPGREGPSGPPGQQAPGLAAPQDVTDRVEDLTVGPFGWPPSELGRGYKRRQDGPFRIRYISWICLAFHPPTLRYFSDTLLNYY